MSVVFDAVEFASMVNKARKESVEWTGYRIEANNPNMSLEAIDQLYKLLGSTTSYMEKILLQNFNHRGQYQAPRNSPGSEGETPTACAAGSEQVK